jgi:hypothetical protein
MTQAAVPVARRRFGETSRRDPWWGQPVAVFLGLSAFIVYVTWAAFQNTHYRFGPYLSPLYSPDLLGSDLAWLGPKPAWWPDWLPFSPALIILIIPAGFRVTCYYYRGAYYKAFWADPPACAVGEPRVRYLGESAFPLIVQNLHRYFAIPSVAYLLILASDVWHGLWFTDPSTGARSFGVGLGTIVLGVNVTLLSGYTIGCHSLRHLVGGRFDLMAHRPALLATYRCMSCLNRQHMGWAWTSLVWVGFTDLYVRLCSMGVWSDWRIL